MDLKLCTTKTMSRKSPSVNHQMSKKHPENLVAVSIRNEDLWQSCISAEGNGHESVTLEEN